MAVNDLITAARYNNAQGRVSAILGNGSGNEGYGQTTTSAQVSSNVIINSTHVNALFTDLNKIYIHQTASVPNSIAEVEVGDTIAEDTSGGDTKEGFKDYEDFISIIETASNRFRLAAAQSSTLNNAKTIQRRNQWTAPIECEFNVSFTDSDTRRHFFNAGGSLTFISSLSATTGTGVVQSIGNYDLTTSYQEIYRKSATGVYGNNNYILFAKASNSSSIQVKYQFYDHNPGGYKIDEPVLGLLEAKIGFVRASGSYVDTPAPAFAATNNL
jgi:hypothetical protein